MDSPTTDSDIFDNFLCTVGMGNLRRLKKMVAKLGDGVVERFAKLKGFEGLAPLHIAAAQGDTRMCKYLIRRLKFDVNIEDDDGETPLTYAISYSTPRLQTVSYLLESGASLAENKKLECTPLHVAILSGRNNLLQIIISRGADIEATSYRGTPLTCAAAYGNEGAVEFLLQNNANINPVNSYNNPLIEASNVSLACTDLLVKAGADPNINFYCTTPLHSAVDGEKVEIIAYLLKAGANPNVVNYMGLTPLEMAALGKDMKSMSILFPVTTPIPSLPNWSIKGIIKYVNSTKATKKMNLMSKRSFLMAKSKGEEAFKREDYWVAINWYTTANKAVPRDVTTLSNNSLCYACLNRGARALSYAEKCVILRPDWPKAHYREGVAWTILKNYNKAAKSFSMALKLAPDNLEIQKALREAIEAEVAELGI